MPLRGGYSELLAGANVAVLLCLRTDPRGWRHWDALPHAPQEVEHVAKVRGESWEVHADGLHFLEAGRVGYCRCYRFRQRRM